MDCPQFQLLMGTRARWWELGSLKRPLKCMSNQFKQLDADMENIIENLSLREH